MQKSRSRDMEARLSSTYLSVKPGERPSTAITAESFDRLSERRCVVCNGALSKSNQFDTCRPCRLMGHIGKLRGPRKQSDAARISWAQKTEAEREAIYEKRWATMRQRREARERANV